MMDFDDCWDSLVQVEEESYKVGFEEGRAAAQTSGIREDGQRGGFLKGLAFGLELGFVEQFAIESLGSAQAHSASLDSTPISPISPETETTFVPPPPPTGASPRSPAPSAAQQRNEKRMKEIISTISAIPNNNHHNSEIDFDKEIQHVRTLYRQAGTPLGHFPPSLTNHVENNKKETVTHEW